jgi:AraC family transcriptional regulator of adaptative response/methylated-DNA-[protein]-cysteine methyltransferase
MLKDYENHIDYQRVKIALEYISVNVNQQPKIEDIAKHINLSKFHFQRMFKKWAGISPKKFLQFITLNELKKEIQNENSIQKLSEKIGLSSQSRVYDLFVKSESVTPFEYKNKGTNIKIEYGIHNSPFGICFIANTARGVCGLEFIDNETQVIKNFNEKWENATITKNQKETQKLIKLIFYSENASIKTLLFGTEFQIKVWEALLKIPFGKLASYQHISDYIESPKANRAVGSAIGKNNLAFIIPCHRVIRTTGEIGQYKWNCSRKTALIGWEKSKKNQTNEY